MSTESRTVSSTKESLLLDQALDAVNRRIAVHQPAGLAQIPHEPASARSGPNKSGFARAISRARERGADFRAEYHRLSIETLAAVGEPAVPADMRKPEPDSAADPPGARSEAGTPVSATAPPAPHHDSALETTKLFLQFLDSREKQLLDLMRAMVIRDQPPAQNSHEARIDGQLDRLGKAVSDLSQAIGASQPKFPRSVS